MAVFHKIKKLFKLTDVEVYIYVSTEKVLDFDSETEFPVQIKNIKGQQSYWMYDGNTVVHKSFLYAGVHIIKLIKKSGLVIGSCYTNPNYRGKSIYPKVISQIVKDHKNSGELFMVVDTDNISSIKGIEKAGFKRLAYIKAKKWLAFYYNKKITIY